MELIQRSAEGNSNHCSHPEKVTKHSACPPQDSGNKRLSRCWDNMACEPLDPTDVLSPHFSIPGITGYHNPGWFLHTGSQNSNLSYDMLISTFLALCDHNPSTLPSDITLIAPLIIIKLQHTDAVSPILLDDAKTKYVNHLCVERIVRCQNVKVLMKIQQKRKNNWYYKSVWQSLSTHLGTGWNGNE